MQEEDNTCDEEKEPMQRTRDPHKTIVREPLHINSDSEGGGDDFGDNNSRAQASDGPGHRSLCPPADWDSILKRRQPDADNARAKIRRKRKQKQQKERLLYSSEPSESESVVGTGKQASYAPDPDGPCDNAPAEDAQSKEGMAKGEEGCSNAPESDAQPEADVGGEEEEIEDARTPRADDSGSQGT